LTDNGEDCVEALIYYLYHLDYPESNSPLALHVKMVIVADKYDIGYLSVIAYVKLVEALRNGVEPSDDLTDAIQAAWEVEAPTKNERQKLLDTVLRPDFSAEHLDMVLDPHPRFARDVAMAQKKGGEPARRWEGELVLELRTRLRCPECHGFTDVEIEKSIARTYQCLSCHRYSMGSRWHQSGLWFK